jgi:hypothetical protein
MSEIKSAVHPAQTTLDQPELETGHADLKVLTELELMLAGGGDIVEPWPK